MGVDIDRAFRPYYGGLAGGGYHVGLSDAGAVFQQLQNLPNNTDDIARITGMKQNPLTGELKTAGDKLLSEIKNTALNVGKKILKGAVSTGVSAVTSLTVGASIGNLIPIPGIGAAIGAIGALVWEGLKALGKALLKLFRPAPQPYQRACPKFKDCPEIPQMPLTDLIPWLGPKRLVISEKTAEQLNKWYCGHGGIRDCLSDLSYFWKEAGKVTLDSVPYLGLPQIERLLVSYRTTPSQFKQFNPNKKQIEWFTVTEPTSILYHLEFRKKKLVDLVTRAQQAASLPGNQIPKLRWDLATELTIAASQVSVSPGPEAISWYKTLGDHVLQLTAREQADSAAARAHSEQIQRRAQDVAKDPAQARSLKITQLQFLCNEAGGRGAACDEVRQLMSGGPAPMPGPQSVPRPTSPAPGPKPQGNLAALAQARNKYVYEYLQRLSQQGNQAAALLFADAQRQPGQFAPAKTYNYLERRSKEGVKPAQLILYAAVTEFQSKLSGARV